jgi:hypothetical protein
MGTVPPLPQTPAPPPSTPRAEPPAAPRPGLRRRAVIFAVVVAVAAVIGAVAGVAIVTRGGSPNDTAGTTDVSGRPSADSVTGGADDDEAEGSGASGAAGTAPDAAGFRCWDGSVEKSLSACPDPTSAATQVAHLAGLNWVFKDRGPRLESARATCHDNPLSPNRALHRSCSFTYLGYSVCMNWSQ